MNDMSQVIIPRSDQISADDFIAGPKTYTIERVEIRPGTEQPVSIFLAGEDRAWRPCKSMSRCLVAAWGPDANVYTGRAVTLYRDPKVKWGGMEVGGIRVSHMSHIEREMLLQLTATKGKRTPHIVKPLAAPAPKQPETPEDPAAAWCTTFTRHVRACTDIVALEVLESKHAKRLTELREKRPELSSQCENVIEEQRVFVVREGKPDDGFGEEFPDA